MDVLVCATQVPFMRGGMEQLVENLVGALGVAGHRAEAVHVPAAWDRERLLDAAVAWRMVPLDADLVITTNFPSYFARHPRKVAWLIHQHRGAYDGIGQPWSDFGLDDASLETQRQLTDWDSRALLEAERRYSISGVVTDRLSRYCGVESTPLYHPPPLAEQLRPGPFGDYVVGVSRLEANKRPGIVVEGALAARSGTRGVMVGTGSLSSDLSASIASAGGAGRVELAGFLPDDELVDLLAGCLAVVYAPYDEDYGYVTLQAFLAGKPVITASDSGGVLEWVTDGETGLVTDGSPAAVGAAIDKLAADPDLARRMGEAGRMRAAALGWPAVVATLLGQPR
jgi:glycosyltransferase involved in cell wall biosynthesis